MKTRILLLFLIMVAFPVTGTDLATLRPKGNAIVTGNWIQPPQAAVDTMYSTFSAGSFATANLSLRPWGDGGAPITHIDVDFLFSNYTITPDEQHIFLDGNALDVATVNAVLAYLLSNGVVGDEIRLDGGTNAAPTGQGLIDKAALISAGWTVTTN